MKFNLLIVKETRSGERRVGLIPSDAKKLINHGHSVNVEHDAGLAAGYSDQDYQNVGVTIRYVDKADPIDSYKSLFSDINLIVRAKRPERDREILESQTINKNTIMIGALDPLERNSKHIDEYHRAGIVAYSIDQLQLPTDNPMNILAAMSKIAGKLAMLDAIDKARTNAKKVVIIGFGTVGQAAFYQAIDSGYTPLVVLHNTNKTNEIKKSGGTYLLMDRKGTIEQQREKLKDLLMDADIVITSARRSNQLAPVLITKDMLQNMQSGCVIVDMALSEGGNVEGSEHDATLTLGNNVIVTNVSGYPKAVPQEASQLWSNASLHVIYELANKGSVLKDCMLSLK